jgi:hypothetical protein
MIQKNRTPYKLKRIGSHIKQKIKININRRIEIYIRIKIKNKPIYIYSNLYMSWNTRLRINYKK